MAVDATGFEGDGRDTALSQPRDQFAQAGRVGRELADGVGAIGCGIDADPVGGVADIDARRMLMHDWHLHHLLLGVELLLGFTGETVGLFLNPFLLLLLARLLVFGRFL